MGINVSGENTNFCTDHGAFIFVPHMMFIKVTLTRLLILCDRMYDASNP